jgi:AcrR family transcriptional regulator
MVMIEADPPHGSLRDRKRQRVAEDLVRAATALFATRGYEQTTVADIAAAATQSRSTFFRYFATKEEVAFHGVPEHLEWVTAEIGRRLDEGDEPFAAVTASILALIAENYVEPDTMRTRMALWLSEPALRGRWAEYSAEWEVRVASEVARHRGTTAASDPYAQAVALAALGGFRIAVNTSAAGAGGLLERVAAVHRVFGAGIESQSKRR